MIITFKPVGVSFRKENVAKIKIKDSVTFKHLPVFSGSGENRKEYPNAIAVIHNGNQVGNLAESSNPRSPQQEILKLLKKGENPQGTVTNLIIPKEGETFQRTYEIELDIPDSSKIKKSFNEDIEIFFDEEKHVYKYDSMQLMSGTNWLKDYYKPFDKFFIADKCSNSWGVPAEDIVNMWESNGNLSASFGTVIHNALEHYDKFKNIGQTILENTDKDADPSVPKHPFLKKIIEGFKDICKDSGDIIPEAVVTFVEKGYCGTIDRLVIINKEKKICRIGDYKVNIDAGAKGDKPKAPFNNLPATKLTKYQLQMSFYAKLLELTGWTVEGIDAYVFDGDWKHYELELIDIDL